MTNTAKRTSSGTISVRTVAGLVAGSALAAAAAPAAQLALAETPLGAEAISGPAPAVIQTAAAQATHAVRTISNIEGTFSWNQGVTTNNATLARNLYGASDVLCGGQGALQLTSLETSSTQVIDRIAVSGDVANTFVAEVEEFEQKAPVRTILGCTCSGNPADGRASANAAVEGFQLKALIAEAMPNEDANTITFVCADGYKVALPLSYVEQRYSIIVTTINGEASTDAVGCANQLWLGTTGARSFARDVVEIRITAQDEPPAAPGTAPNANLPNVGVIAGASA